MSDFSFIDINAEQITQYMINEFEKYTGESLPIGDARRQFIQALAYVMTVMSNNINTTGKQNLLRYAFGDGLEGLGELLGVYRLEKQPATTNLEFTLSQAQPTAVIIPKGTRATPDGKIYFASDEALTIAGGSISGSVTATATIDGEKGNGFLPGQINKIVDGIPYVGTVTNLTASINGKDIESDDDMRERIRIAPFSFSTAGAMEAYKYLAMSANPNVGDADPYVTSAGCVTIAVVKKDGTLPQIGDEILTDVENACSAKTSRPLTDNVTVAPAAAVTDTIEVSYYISIDDSAVAEQIRAGVQSAVDEYSLWQTTKIGRDINPDRLRKLMYNAGAYSVEITAPTAQMVDDGEVAQFTDINITYAGLKI